MTTSRFCKDTKVFSIRNVMKNLWWVETKSSLSLSLSLIIIMKCLIFIFCVLGRQILQDGNHVMASSIFAIHGNNTLKLES